MKSIALILTAVACAFGQVAINGQLSSRQPIQPKSFDCAADGSVVNSVTGEPVVRAHVGVFAGEYSYSTATDSSGNWSLANLACIPSQLQVTRTGFLQVFGKPGARGPSQLNLTSGTPVHARSELIPQSVAYGKVVDDQGDPVQSVQVMSLMMRVVDGHPRFQQAGGMTTTNDLGEYRLSGLSKGKYIFCAHTNQPGGPIAPRGSQTVAADACYPGPIDGGIASSMDVPAGRETKVDFTLSEVPAVHVRGTITGLPEGRGSGLRIFRRGVESGNLPGNVRDGKFDFRVPPGAYTLAADYFEAGTRLTARMPVDVGNSDLDDIVVHLETGFTVTGVVHAVSQSGNAVTRQFGVGLRSSDLAGSGGQMKWDPSGTSFSINEMTPGSYRLEASPPPPFYVKSATLAGQDILNNEVPIQQAAGPIDIELRDDGGSVEGDVTDSSGQPPASTNVMLLRGNIRVANLTSGGHFKIQNLAPGDYTIYAWDSPDNVQYADPDWLRRNGTGGMAVTVAAGQSQQIKLVQQIVPE